MERSDVTGTRTDSEASEIENYPCLSLIVPCRNEEGYIQVCLDSILANDYPKDRLEIWVVDGRSEDGTRAILERYAKHYSFLRILENPKKNVCAAMNLALEQAQGEIVFKMDAHSTYERDYISRCVNALRETNADNVGGKFVIQPGDKTLIAKAIALAMAHPFGIGRYYEWMHSLEEPTEVETVSFGCFKKEMLIDRGLDFNEELARGGDSEFNARLRKKGGRVLLMPDIVFDYFARPTLKELWKHQASCGFWVVYWTRFGCKLTLRSFLVMLFVLGLFVFSLITVLFPQWAWVWVLGFIVYGALNLYFSFKSALKQKDIRMFFLMPVVFGTMHVARGLGSLYGSLSLAKQRERGRGEGEEISPSPSPLPLKVGGEGKHPKVAVLMPVYYKEKPELLSRSIESILNQTYQNLDIHLYQDGPFGEELTRVVKSYTDRFSNLTAYQNPVHRGSSFCMNDMLEKVVSHYLYFARMDSDDISHPERIAKQVAFLESHPDVDVVGGSIVDIDESGKELKQVRYPLTHEEIVRFFKKRNPMAHVTIMFRRSYFEKAGFYPPVRLEDGLLWMQGIAAGCRFQNIPDFLVYVRRTDDFLKRRSGFKMCWQEFQVKLTINRKLKYGLSSYFYALAMFGVQLLPVPIKRILYEKLR